MDRISATFLNRISKYKDKGLRDYQAHHKLDIYSKWKKHRSILLQMPTGAGKTRLYASMINDFKMYSEKYNENVNVLIVTHRKELVRQIKRELFNPYQIDCSLITPEERYSHRNPLPVCVASIFTLNNRAYFWSDYHFDFIIIDEAHHSKGATYKWILRTFKKSKILGVTATPYRMNGAGLASEYEELIVSPSIKDFIEAGWLSNYDYYSIKPQNKLYRDIDNVVKLDTYGDYSVGSLWNYCGKDSIRAEIVASYLKYAKGKKGIVYTINRAHNEQLCREFRRCGVIAYGIDSETKEDVRDDIVKRFRKGEIDVLCNVNIFTEGFDCPDVEFIQLARPTKSLGLYLQQVGRGLRIAANKTKVLFIDNVGLYNRFGMPSSKRKWGMYFVGLEASEEKKEYAKNIDENIFELKKRNVDLSEGCEKMHLIQTTGLNNILKNSKKEYVSSYGEEIKRIVDDIFKTNKLVYEDWILGFPEEHLSFSSKLIEDLLSPCPLYTFKATTDDKDFIEKKMKKEFKPIVLYYVLGYEEYKDLKDYTNTKKEMVYKIFRKKLRERQKDNLEKLNNYTADQLRIFFETYYGPNHNMTKKFNEFCDDYNPDDKWSLIKDHKIFTKHAKIKTVKRRYDEVRLSSIEYVD